VAHTKSCAISLRDPRTCKCACDGALHGVRWAPKSQPTPEGHPAPPQPGTVRSRQRKIRRALGAITVGVALTFGGLTVTGTFDSQAGGTNESSASDTGDSPPSGASHLTTQANVDLKETFSTLSSLGFKIKDTPSSGSSGFVRSKNCAATSTGQVSKFFTSHPCEQYIAETWTITRQGKSTSVAFSLVEMSTPILASLYKTVVDTYGTGNPPGVSSQFDGQCYASNQQESAVEAVEVKPLGEAKIDQGILQDSMSDDLSQAYLERHCVK
jgi:hypothetical protein